MRPLYRLIAHTTELPDGRLQTIRRANFLSDGITVQGDWSGREPRVAPIPASLSTAQERMQYWQTWHLTDDLGTSYEIVGASTTGTEGTQFTVRFSPALQHSATLLSLQTPDGEQLEISLMS